MSQGSGKGSPGARKSPAMEQYLAIREENPGAILFFRIGDFYETFGSDAELVSRELDIVLTSRSKGAEGNRIPLAGVPYHAAEGYISRLVAKGYRVAVCDQVGDARPAKGIVPREVVRVITPGTLIDPGMAPGTHARYLMAVSVPSLGTGCSLAFLDISTGEFFASSCGNEAAFRSEIARHRPSECIAGPALPENLAAVIRGEGIPLTPCPDEFFDPARADTVLRDHLGVESLAGFGCDRPGLAGAAAAALRYAKETQKSALPQIRSLSDRTAAASLVLDAVTLRNLEVLESISGRNRSGTLIGALDMTATAMGSRLLASWITAPLLDPEKIAERLDAVSYYSGNPAARRELRDTLGRLGDVARIAGRIAYGNAGPRDLVTLQRSLSAVPQIRALHVSAPPALVASALGSLSECRPECDLIGRAIADDPPVLARNGGVIREGFDGELDRERERSGSGRGWVLELQQVEREKTGIKSLKVGYTSVFGYYIEVSKANSSLVPSRYERKQTTSGGERYTIPELREKEAVISDADERSLSLETAIYGKLISDLRESVPALQETAAGIALLDLVSALTEVAVRNRYVRPDVDGGIVHVIREARHPVVERQMEGAFVPNDLALSADREQVLIITGANMAGKSTYMRSIALITLMAQMGSFVPASYARIGVVDRIFTRVGAFDDLARGQSTFMVEMLELANILNHVTGRSLVILDEIGRGTSTLDGFCIAQAVLEYLHGRGSSGTRTLFATHFHELVGIEGELRRVRNYHFAVKDTGRSVVFLRKLIPGATDRSYGIHVAERAGIPQKVIGRANALLEEVQKREYRPGTVKRYTQLLLPDSPEQPEHRPDEPAMGELRRIDPDSLTPLEALGKLYELKKLACGDSSGADGSTGRDIPAGSGGRGGSRREVVPPEEADLAGTVKPADESPGGERNG